VQQASNSIIKKGILGFLYENIDKLYNDKIAFFKKHSQSFCGLHMLNQTFFMVFIAKRYI
jgi:hypothetical protein